MPLMLNAVAQGRLTLQQVVRAMAGAPARAFGLQDRKGGLHPGMDADIVIVDMEKNRNALGPGPAQQGQGQRL